MQKLDRRFTLIGTVRNDSEILTRCRPFCFSLLIFFFLSSHRSRDSVDSRQSQCDGKSRTTDNAVAAATDIVDDHKENKTKYRPINVVLHSVDMGQIVAHTFSYFVVQLTHSDSISANYSPMVFLSLYSAALLLFFIYCVIFFGWLGECVYSMVRLLRTFVWFCFEGKVVETLRSTKVREWNIKNSLYTIQSICHEHESCVRITSPSHMLGAISACG